jgi:hypothetical protein
VWSHDALAAALATAADLPADAVPRHANAWLERAGRMPHDRAHLVVLSELANATRYGDFDAWRTRIAMLEKDWLEPLTHALMHGRLSRLLLATPGAAHARQFEVTRADLMKFWRGKKPLREYA